ncbi:MAG: S8 family serine peptidase, partial [Hyphomicrobiales bacterium]
MTKKQHWDTSGTTDPLARQTHSIPSDNLFDNQWHLLNTGQSGGIAGIDLNVTDVWDDYTGQGVTVAVYDDSVQYTHHDLNNNYDASQHITIGGSTHDPAPNGGSDNHGTAVAGIIAAENDGTGTVGVAYDATLVGVDALALNTFADLGEAMDQQRNFDVVNHSWGFITPFDANEQDATWSAFFFSGIDDAVDNGRGGLGTNIVTSGGNDRTADRDVNDSNFTSTRQTIAVGAMSHDDSVSWYSTPGASLLVSATTNGPAGSGVWTTDRTGGQGYNTSGGSNGDYTGDFGGTSASAPMVSGVIALMLEANEDLGWRDVQQILSYSARHAGSDVGSAPSGDELYQWEFNGADNWNGGGLHFSNDYGFGRVDALAAVRLAETWDLQSTSANEATATRSWSGTRNVPDNNTNGVSISLNVGTSIQIEAVELDLTGSHSFVGDLVITLTSPDGTVSTLLDTVGSSASFPSTGWTFTSQAFRGELSAGTWTINISDVFAGATGVFTGAVLTAYGAADTADDLYVYTDEFGTYGNQSARQTLDDTDGGTDTINAAAVTTGSVIDLNAGATSTVAGRTFTMAAGAVVENAYGGDGDDVLTGNAVANALDGGRGDDTLQGGGGSDDLNGGSGFDLATYASSSSGVTVSLTTGAGAGGDAEGDQLSGIEHVQGSNFADVLTGDAGKNFLYGLDGNDQLFGLAGDDKLFGGGGHDDLYGGSGAELLDGGGGFDLARYLNSSAGVTVDLTTGTGSGGDAEGDQLIGIEHVQGSNFDDVLTGDAGKNFLYGQDGNDQLFGLAGDDKLFGGGGHDDLYGGSGAELLDGGSGFDLARYLNSSAGVTVDLTTGTGSGGDAEGDQLIG